MSFVGLDFKVVEAASEEEIDSDAGIRFEEFELGFLGGCGCFAGGGEGELAVVEAGGDGVFPGALEGAFPVDFEGAAVFGIEELCDF